MASSLLACIAPESGKCEPCILASFLWPYSLKKIPEEAKSALLKSSVVSFPCCCLKELELHYFMVTTARATLEFHIPHQALCWSSRTPLQVGSSIPWRRRFLPRQSSNVLDCLHLTVLSFQQTSEWLKSSIRVRFVNVRLLLSVYRGLYLLGLPGQVACSRPSLFCHLSWSFL